MTGPHLRRALEGLAGRAVAPVELERTDAEVVAERAHGGGVSAYGAWKPTWFTSIRVRFVFTVAALLLITSLGSTVLVRVALLADLEDEVQTQLDREVEEFRLLAGGTDPQTGRPFRDVAAIFDVYFAREVPDEGETILAFVDGRLYESRRAIDAAEPGQLEEAIDYWLSLDEQERGELDTPAGSATYVAVPVRDGGDGLFVVANFPAFERSEIDQAVRTALVAQLAGTGLGVLLALLLAGRKVRPLRDLAETALSIQDTELSRRIPASGRDETSQIAAAFNAMLDRLQSSFETQRRFLDDTSHELRSPMTVIRGHLELLELSGAPEERRQTIELVLDEVDRVTALLGDLTLLARAEQPGFARPQPTDLHELILEVHQKCTALGDRDWVAEPPGAVVVTLDRQRITQAIIQLASNAVKYTRPGDAIRIGANTDPETIRLWVDDSGQGVDPQDAEIIFARFARGRAHQTDPARRGLGLAIVSAIARAHGGQARLVPKTSPGARFEIELPRTVQ
jgi:two-component system OmpR family sensor kinase